jgi:hypothetical protein
MPAIGTSGLLRSSIAARHIRAAMAHTCHVHAHILHRRHRPAPQRRHDGGHARARRQRGARHARSIAGFADDGEGTILGRRDDHVIGLARPELEFVDIHRTDRLAVGLHDGQRQPRYPHVEDRHAGCVDEAQPHRSPGLNKAVQLSSGPCPLIR